MSTAAKNGGDHMTENSDSGTFGRYQEVPVEHLAPEMKAAYEFTLGMRGHLPGPSRSGWPTPGCCRPSHPPAPTFKANLSPIAIVVIVFLHWTSSIMRCCLDSNSEHEQIGQVAGGLAPQKVQALIAGLPTSFDDPRQQVFYELSSALIGPRVVPQGLYQRARELLGDRASSM
jgi:4-carboxymuconolactone decarboxylase